MDYMKCYESDFEDDLHGSDSEEPDVIVVDNIFGVIENKDNIPPKGLFRCNAGNNVEEDIACKEQPSKKICLCFENQKQQQLQPSLVYEALQKMQNAASKCCALACFAWFSITLVLSCRNQYLSCPTSKDRAEWLEQRLKEMEDKTKNRPVYSYYVEQNLIVKDSNEIAKQKCCEKAWEFTQNSTKMGVAHLARHSN